MAEMVQAGIGVYMFEIERMQRALKRHPFLANRLFTEDERQWCNSTARPIAHYAELIAARGAVARALGITPDAMPASMLYLRDISVCHDESSKVHVELIQRAAELAEVQGVREIALSLSSTFDVAVANAVALTDEVRPQIDETPTQKEELQATFRAAREVLTELEQYSSEQGASF